MPDYEKAAELLIEKCDKLRDRIFDRIEELEAENKRYKDVLEFLVVSKANDRVKMECVEQALKG